jgi:hypothetical protein
MASLTFGNQGDAPKSGERQLGCAVIAPAIEGALTPRPAFGDPRIRSEAVHFLIGRTEAWTRTRRLWSDIAGIDEAALCDRMLPVVMADDETLRRRRLLLHEAAA